MKTLRDTVREVDERNHKKFIALGTEQLNSLQPTLDELNLALEQCIVESIAVTPLNIAQFIVSFRHKNVLETKDAEKFNALKQLEDVFKTLGYNELSSKITSIKNIEFSTDTITAKIS